MDPIASVITLLILIAATTVLGLLWRVRTGRVRRPSGQERLTPASLGLGSDAAFGARATLLQFSTEFCAQCPATGRLLSETAASNDGVVHLDLDLTRRPELAARFGVLQTPTVLLLDHDGVSRARIGGAPRRSTIDEQLQSILTSEHVRLH